MALLYLQCDGIRVRNFPAAAIAFVFLIVPSLVAYLNRSTTLFFAVAALAALAHTIKTKPSPIIKLNPVLCAYVLWGILSALWEYDSGLALPESLQLVGLLIGSALICRSVQSFPAEQTRLIRLAALTGAVLALCFLLIDWSADCAILKATQFLRHREDPWGCLLAREKSLPAVLSIMAPIILGWAWGNRAKLVLAAAFIGGLVLAGKVSDSHSTMMALAAAGTVWLGALIVGPKIMGRVVASCAVLLVLSAPLLPPLLPQPKELAETMPRIPNSTRHRLMIWQFTATRIAERPLLGWGLNGSRSIPGNTDKTEVWLHDPNATPQDFPLLQDQLPLHPHNFALQIWLETGGVGAVLVSLFLWRFFTQVSRRWGAPALAAGVAAMAVGLVGFGIWQAWWLSCLWLIAAITPLLLPVRPDRTGHDPAECASPECGP